MEKSDYARIADHFNGFLKENKYFIYVYTIHEDIVRLQASIHNLKIFIVIENAMINIEETLTHREKVRFGKSDHKNPWVTISKEGLFDEDGNWKEIPAGKMGMHYASAVKSAIAYANDSYMETVPHEYIHEYINMYRETKLVKDAISRYGEENLVSLIAKKYTGQKMSGQIETFIKKLWKMIRGTFGSPSVVDILTDSLKQPDRNLINMEIPQLKKTKSSLLKRLEKDQTKLRI